MLLKSTFLFRVHQRIFSKTTVLCRVLKLIRQSRVHFDWFNLVDLSISNTEGAIMVLAVYCFPYLAQSRFQASSVWETTV